MRSAPAAGAGALAGLIILLAACGSRSPSVVPGGSASDGTVPPFGDVTSYRVDAAGSVAQPGPGPAGAPTIAWAVHVGSTHWSPILVDGRVIVGTAEGEVIALDGRTGAELWRFQTAAGLATDRLNGSAAAANGLVYVSDPSTLYALDVATGAQRWTARVETEGSRPLVVDGRVYVGSVGGAVGFDAASGAVAWQWAGPAGIATTVGPVSDGVVYVSSRADGRVYAVDSSSGVLRWSAQTISLAVGSGDVANGSLYVATNQAGSTVPVGELYAIDVTSGSIRWRYRGPSGLQLVAGPVRDGVVFVSSEADGITALHDDSASYAQVWHVDAPPTYFPLSIVGETLYEARNDGSVGAYSTVDGALRWETPATADTAGGPPLVSGGMVFIVGDGGLVTAYADPTLVASLPTAAPGAPSETASASPTAPAVADPFTVTRSIPWTSLGLAVPLGMDAGPDGLLYVLDTKPSVVVIDPAAGRVVRTWGRQGAGNGQFDVTRADDNPGTGDVAVGPDGRVFVADGTNHRVQVFKPDGTYLTQFGSFGTGDGQFASVNEISAGPDGSLYLRDEGTNRVNKFTAQGTFVWHSSDTGSDADLGLFLQGVAVSGNGSILVTCEGCDHLVRLDPALGMVTGRLPVPALHGEGGSITTDAHGRIYVTTFNSESTLVLDSSGALVGGRYLGNGMRMDIGKRATWGDPFWPSPVFLPDGRAFTFWKDGLAELSVAVPAG